MLDVVVAVVVGMVVEKYFGVVDKIVTWVKGKVS